MKLVYDEAILVCDWKELFANLTRATWSCTPTRRI